MTDYEKYNTLIKSRLSEHRYIHSVNVANAAARLAKLNGADEEKACLAGILHDVMKEAPLEVQYEYIKKNGENLSFAELHNPAVIHQMSGAAFCRLELGHPSARSEFGSFAAGLFDNLGVNFVDFVNQLGVFEMARIFVEKSVNV